MIEDINKNIISAHKSNLEMEETDMHIADGSHSSPGLPLPILQDVLLVQEKELFKTSEDMVGDTSQPVSSNEEEVLVMGGKDHVSHEIGNAAKRPRIEDVEQHIDIQLSEIEAKVDNILDKLQLHLGNQNVKVSPQNRVKLKLDFIISNINLTNTVKDLEQVVKEVQKMTVSKESEDVE